MMSFLAHEHIFDATEMMSFLAHEQKDRKKRLKKRRGVSHTCKYTANNSEFEEKTPFEARVSEFLRKLTI